MAVDAAMKPSVPAQPVAKEERVRPFRDPTSESLPVKVLLIALAVAFLALVLFLPLALQAADTGEQPRFIPLDRAISLIAPTSCGRHARPYSVAFVMLIAAGWT